ncbi:MAG: FKBP-type peptidyl-prolyl cis-trans isomerase SlyD [Saprospiraceae bacterium]|jgi:FKBP-type peptidyl-prolyl cis-trans isomerase SlyD
MIISKNSAVYFQYSLSDETGDIIDASSENEPMAYLQGHNSIIPGLEKEMEGKKSGDVMVVTVEPKEAYGERKEEMVQQIPRESFKAEDIKIGMRFEATTPNGAVSVVVADLTDETVTVDGNHPLAGKKLTFDVRISDVREATKEELTHGHIHGLGGHQH